MHLDIIILGADCAKCNTFFQSLQKIVQHHGLEASVEKITDTDQMISYGIHSLPAMVVNSKIVITGMVPNENEIIKLLNDFLPENEKLPVIQKQNRKRIPWLIILIAGIIITLGIAFSFSEQNKKKDKIPLTDSLSASMSIADSVNMLFNYSDKQSTYQITFLEFGSKGCIECKKMEEVMEEVRANYPSDVNVVYYDANKKTNKKIVRYFEIHLIPVQILLDKNGKEFFRHVGYYSFSELVDKFKKMGVPKPKF